MVTRVECVFPLYLLMYLLMRRTQPSLSIAVTATANEIELMHAAQCQIAVAECIRVELFLLFFSLSWY